MPKTDMGPKKQMDPITQLPETDQDDVFCEHCGKMGHQEHHGLVPRFRRSGKVHIPFPSDSGNTTYTLCGLSIYATEASGTYDDVDCKRCLKKARGWNY